MQVQDNDGECNAAIPLTKQLHLLNGAIFSSKDSPGCSNQFMIMQSTHEPNNQEPFTRNNLFAILGKEREDELFIESSNAIMTSLNAKNL